MHFRLYLALAALLFLVIFTLQNASVVTINFLFWKFTASRALIVFFVLAAGIVIGWALAGLTAVRSRQR